MSPFLFGCKFMLVNLLNYSLEHKIKRRSFHTMDVRIRTIYENSYLNIISAIFKDLDLPPLIDRLVPVVLSAKPVPVMSFSCSRWIS